MLSDAEDKVENLMERIEEEYEYVENKHHVQEKLEKALDEMKKLHKKFMD